MNPMKNKLFVRLCVFGSALASLLLAGCASVSNAPFTGYTAQEKIHLKVAVNITDELLAAKNDKWNIPIGEFIATNAPVLAQNTFDEVIRVRNGQVPATENVGAVLTPKVAYLTRTIGATGGGESIVDMKVEWTLSDPKGNAVWVDTIDGRSSASTRSNYKKVARAALEDLLTRSQQAISSAAAIREFAQKEVVSKNSEGAGAGQ